MDAVVGLALARKNAVRVGFVLQHGQEAVLEAPPGQM